MSFLTHLFNFDGKDFLDILLIEESTDVANYLREILSREKQCPFDLTVAHTLGQARAALEEKRPDLILLGVHGTDISIAENLLEEFPDLLIVVVSDKNDPLMIPSLFKAGVQEVLLREQVTVALLWRTIFYAYQRHQQQLNLKKIIDSNADGILVVDKKSRILFFNKAAEELFQPRELLHAWRELGAPVASSSPVEIELASPDGRIKTLEMRSVDIMWDAISGNLISLRDITERKRISEEMMHSDRLAGIGALAAGVSHEVLNPLNIISMNVQMKKRKEVSPEWEEFLDSIQGEVKRIEKILQTLLKFSRKEEGALRQMEVNGILDETLSLLDESLALSNVQVIREMDPELPKINGDPDQLRQVILNLVQNAHYAMANGGRLTLRSCQRQEDDETIVEVAVLDTGTGIRKQDLKRVMEPFFTTKPEGKGTGLGLAVCHGIINQFGGSLAIDSVEGKGTSVYLRFPTAKGSA